MRAKIRSVNRLWWIVWGGVLTELVVVTALSIRDGNGYEWAFAGLTAVYVGLFVFWIWATDA